MEGGESNLHPSPGKRHRMENSDEEIKLYEEKRHLSTIGRAAAEEEGKAATAVAEKEWTRAKEGAPCGPPSALGLAASKMTEGGKSNPPPSPRKRQRIENSGEETRVCEEKRHCSTIGRAAAEGEGKAAAGGAPCGRPSALGQAAAAAGMKEAKAAMQMTQRKGMADTEGTSMSQENKNRSNLSRRAQSRHTKNNIRARIRSMIPGPGKVSENSLMLQTAARIRELEMQIDSAADHLQRLEGTSGDQLDKNFKDQNVHAASASASGGSSPILIGQQAGNGHETLRAVLPQPTKAKGTRLLGIASQYIEELVEENNKLQRQIDDHQGCT